jgi:branched-chain amino acid transport system permease protein
VSFQEQISQFLFSGLTTGSIYALVALGFCIIHNATGIVNFTQVDFITLGGMVMYSLLRLLGFGQLAAFPLAVGAVALVGALVQRLTIQPSRSKEVIHLIFITIGVSIVLRGGIKQIWGKSSMALPHISGEEPLRLLGATVLPQSLWILGITLAVVGGLHLFFTRTLTGKAMRATASNPLASNLMGVEANRMVMLSFALSGTLGAVAGVLIVPITTLAYDVGIIIGLKGFAGAILGGYGNFFGAVLGGLLLGVLEALGAGLVSSAYKDVIAFVILLMVLFVRPAGILGRGEARRV